MDEALDSLHKAIDLRPSYENAMAYINLAYRRKAEIECGNDDARKADLQQAQDWTEKALGARKANLQKANQSAKPGVDTTITAARKLRKRAREIGLLLLYGTCASPEFAAE